MGILFTPASDDIVVVDAASDLENLFDGGNCTLSAKIRFTSYGGGGFGRICGTDSWRFYVYDDGDRLGFSYTFSTGVGIWTTPTDSLEIDTWYSVTVRFDADSTANDPEFTIDGVAAATTQVVGPTGTRVSDAGDRLTIGNNLDYDRGFDGILGDLRVIGRALIDDECTELHVLNGSFPNPDSEVRRYRMLTRPALGLNTPYVSSLENTESDSTTVVLTVPSHNDGDGLVMVVSSGGETTTAPNITTPSGWTLVRHDDTAATPPTWPSVAIYTRAASSEPASYTISHNQDTTPWAGCIINYKDLGLTPDNDAASTGTTDSPISPSGTASVNCMTLWVAVMDSNTQMPTIRGDFGPPGVRIRHVMSANGGGSNGCTVGVGEEMTGTAATGTRTWNGVGSDQWVAIRVQFPYGDGIEGLPVKDESNAQGHGETFFAVVGAEDTLDG